MLGKGDVTEGSYCWLFDFGAGFGFADNRNKRIDNLKIRQAIILFFLYDFPQHKVIQTFCLTNDRLPTTILQEPLNQGHKHPGVDIENILTLTVIKMEIIIHPTLINKQIIHLQQIHNTILTKLYIQSHVFANMRRYREAVDNEDGDGVVDVWLLEEVDEDLLALMFAGGDDGVD